MSPRSNHEDRLGWVLVCRCTAQSPVARIELRSTSRFVTRMVKTYNRSQSIILQEKTAPDASNR
jgi:hypothetical protein